MLYKCSRTGHLSEQLGNDAVPAAQCASRCIAANIGAGVLRKYVSMQRKALRCVKQHVHQRRMMLEGTRASSSPTHQGAQARASCASCVMSSTGARGLYLTTCRTYSSEASRLWRPLAASSTRPAAETRWDKAPFVGNLCWLRCRLWRPLAAAQTQ